MSRIASSLVREVVEIEKRRYLSDSEKRRRWFECKGLCAVCRQRCGAIGPTVIWDHRVPLALGGTNDPANFEPNHASVCAAEKTRRDIAAIAKAKRLSSPSKRQKRKIAGRSFSKELTRGFDGKVKERKS